MSSGEGVDASSQRKRNYKLIVDPELDPSATKKVYRFNGILTGFKPIPDPTDPRVQKTVLGGVKPAVDLIVPKFKYDKFSVTQPPRSDVLLLGICETAQGDLLKNLLLSEVGPYHFVKCHRHPKTNVFLGAASVSFKKNGHGLLAEELLDGRMLCGRHIKVQLDDKGDKAREFLREIVEGGVKKTINDNSDRTSIRRLSSTSSQKADDVAVNDTAKDTSDTTVDGSPSAGGSKIYPLSILNINAGSVTPLYDTPSSVTNTSVPPTPSSLDSGLSMTMPKQDNVVVDNPKQLFAHSALNCPPVAVINRKTVTSPLPINNDITIAIAAKVDPPLPAVEDKAPPLPSAPPNDIDDISISPISMEGEVPDGVGGGGNKRDPRTAVDMVSPVSMSPAESLTEYDATLKAEDAVKTPTLFPTQFDPTLGLKGLFKYPQPTAVATPAIDLMPVSPPEYNDPAVTVVSPPVTNIEVEEISGDESPEMVYMYSSDRTNGKTESVTEKEAYKVQVEQLSSDDMEMASDEENTVIEVNPTSVTKQNSPPLPANHMIPPYMDCRLPPPLPPPLPHPPNQMFPPHPGGMPPQIPFKPPPPPYFDPTSVPQFHPPPHHHHHHHHHHMDHHPMGPKPPPFHHYDNGPYRHPMYHPAPKGSVKRYPGVGGKESVEDVKREVMMVVCQQLRDILVRDMRKSLVEISAFSSLDSFWERREKMKQERLMNRTNRINETPPIPTKEASPVITKDSQPLASKENDPSAAATAGAPAASVEDEPYRQLLPDQAEEEEVTPQQPRKRLLNFKIPLLNKGSQRRNQGVSLVARRKVVRPHSPVLAPPTVTKRKRKPSLEDSYSDISSVSSSSESDVSAEEDIPSQPSPTAPTTSKIVETESDEESDDDSDIYEQLRNTRKLSVNSVYSDKESSEEEEEGEGVEENLSQEEVEPSPSLPVAMHTDHMYAKPPKTPEAQSDTDNVVVEINEEDEKLKKEEMLTAQARQHTFPAWSSEEEDKLVNKFRHGYGPDKEEVEMFKLALKRLKGEKDDLVNDVPWAYYPSVPPDPIPIPNKRRKLAQQHVTGSAHSEGYYKIDPMDKKAYLRHSLHSFATPMLRNEASKKEESLSRSRSNRAAHRRLASVFSTGDASTDIHKFNQLKARKKQLKFPKSRIHGWGLFAMENIAADEMVIEYVGEVIRSSVADEREKRYEAAGIGSSYLFRMDQDYVIDATKKGSLARFINHCCDPNCYAKVINFGFQRKIVIYSKRDIKATEEITYNYKFPIEEEKIPCLCGAPNCRGILN